MDPQDPFCHHLDCPARGLVGQGQIPVQSRADRRFQCSTCGRTFAATRATPSDRKRTAHDVIPLVLTWLTHGCPLPAIVAAFGCDERTVAQWPAPAGQPCQRLHGHRLQQRQVDRQHVPADEMDVQRMCRRVGMAMALAVPSRLWLGGVISPRRDLVLITTLVPMVRWCARNLAILVCVDGLASYVPAFRRRFRNPVRTGRRGRPRLEATPGLLIGPVIKRRLRHRLESRTRRLVQGTAAAITAVRLATGSGTAINTADLERLKATFRGAMTPLVRRGRALARTEGTLEAGMFLVGCADNFCWEQESLRLATAGEGGRKGQGRTPAMAAGLTDHQGTRSELLSHRVPPPLWVAPKRRGRPPKPKDQPEDSVAA